jgi:hypothetical protein
MTDPRVTELDYDAIRARVEKATDGPWTWVENAFEDDPPEMHRDHGWTDQGPDLVSLGDWHRCGYGCTWPDPQDNETDRGVRGKPGHEHRGRDTVIGSWGHDAWGITVNRADGEFIAHAREDVPALLDRIEVLERENARLKMMLDGFAESYGGRA